MYLQVKHIKKLSIPASNEKSLSNSNGYSPHYSSIQEIMKAKAQESREEAVTMNVPITLLKNKTGTDIKCYMRVREVAQWLRAHIALSEV